MRTDFADMKKVLGPAELGEAKLDYVEVTKFQAAMSRIQAYSSIFEAEEGRYMRLYVGGRLMMTDTPMERRTNGHLLLQSHGDMLIGGLGMGMVLTGILPKPEVKTVTVVEKSADVIVLVEPAIRSSLGKLADKLTVAQGDILTWRPAKGTKFNCIYFDIWPDICEDNLKTVSKLHRSFARFLNRADSGAWMDSWMADYLRSQRRRGY